MQKIKTAILSTRPLSKQLINEAAMHNINIDEISFIETQIIHEVDLNDKIETYLRKNITAIFTSMNAVDAVAAHVKEHPNWKIYSIGNTTKQLVIDNFGENSKSYSITTSLLSDLSTMTPNEVKLTEGLRLDIIPILGPQMIYKEHQELLMRKCHEVLLAAFILT